MSEDRYVVVNGKGEWAYVPTDLADAHDVAEWRNARPSVWLDGPYSVMRVTLTPIEDEPVVPTDIVDRLVQLQTWLEGRVERERALVDLLNLWLSWCTDIHGDPATEPSDYIVNETRAALGLPPRDELPAELPEDLPEKVHIRVYGNGEWAWLDDLGSSPWPDARTFVASLPREAWREVAR